jgi:anti-sigma28 factor (negative regulator of flagellin synthesis)
MPLLLDEDREAHDKSQISNLKSQISNGKWKMENEFICNLEDA